MKASKYAQLLRNSTANLTTLNFHSAQINLFIASCKSLSLQFNEQLDNINSKLLILKEFESAICKEDLELLHTAKKDLDKLARNLKQDLEKPALDYRKSLEKLDKELNEKILPELSGYGPTSGFDLKYIFQNVEQSKQALNTCKLNLDLCFKEIIKVQTKLFALEGLVHNLDLPHELEKTSSTIEKLTKDLSSLSLQIAAQPKIKQIYQKEFSPLLSALTNLKLQSQFLIEEEKSSKATDICDAKPKLGL